MLNLVLEGEKYMKIFLMNIFLKIWLRMRGFILNLVLEGERYENIPHEYLLEDKVEDEGIHPESRPGPAVDGIDMK